MSRIRSLLKQVLHLEESPHRTALAFALGVFIAFSPTYGLHTLSVVFCAWAFRLNAVALLAGSLINNPWTVVPIIGATFWTGFWLLGAPDTAPVNWSIPDLRAFYEQVIPYAAPFLLGGLTLSLAGGALGYGLAYVFVSQHRHKLHRHALKDGQLPPESV
jgi:uncharacterized protein (DUF2062 family)